VLSTYEVHEGKRPVALRTASSAHEVLHDYLRALGCVDAEVVRLGPDAAAWRGAVYRVVPAPGSDVRAAS
jgi:hypothetical protein